MKQSIMLGASLCLLSACAQPPAPVALKGDRFYGKEAERQFAAQRHIPKPDYTPPAQALAAPAPEVEVATLPQPKPIESRPLEAVQPEMQSASLRFVSQPEAKLPEQMPFQTVRIEPQPSEAIATPQLEPLPIETMAAEKQTVSQALAAAAPQPAANAPKLAELGERSSNFIWPVEGAIVSRFGPKQNGLVNDGINIAAREGEPIWAAAKGEVVYAGNELKGYGNMVIIKHANGWMTAYAHASDMLVNKGDSVNQGDLIGYVGQTGAVTSAQLHFGVREGKTPVDPENLLPRRVASAQ